MSVSACGRGRTPNEVYEGPLHESSTKRGNILCISFKGKRHLPVVTTRRDAASLAKVAGPTQPGSV